MTTTILQRIILISCLLLTLFGVSCNKKDPGTENTEMSGRFYSLRMDAINAATRLDLDKADSLGRILYREACDAHDEVNMAYGLYCQGYYTNSGRNTDKRRQFVKEAETIALKTNNDTLLSSIYNMLGAYATLFEPDFSMGRHYYSEAIRYARRCKIKRFEISAECNLAELYHTFGDTLGIKYDRDIYEYAVKTDNRTLLLPSAQRCAEYYIGRPGEQAEAMRYIEKLEADSAYYLVYLLRGQLNMASGNIKEARRQLDLAVKEDIQTPNLYYTYAVLLNSTGEYDRSNSMLRAARKAYDEVDKRSLYYADLWRVFADNYRHLGTADSALYYQDRYISARDSINFVKNKEEISNAKVKFDVEKKEMELGKQREIIRWQRFALWTVAASLLTIVLCVIFYKWRKKSFQKVIVRQQKDFISERNTLPKLPVDSASAVAPAADSRNGLSAHKTEAIWALILHEMEDNHIYADTSVTRDIFSERIGCNHTWFSQVIKEKTGKSYPGFMNGWRIKEALKILSSPEDISSHRELAAKLGFLSASTFYSTFKQQMGMSPADYRRVALKE